MNARDEEIEAIAASLKDKHMGDGLADLWNAMQESGEAVSGREVALIVQSEKSKVAKAIVLFNLILERIDKAADSRAADEAETAYQSTRKPRASHLRGKAHEDAEDLR